MNCQKGLSTRCCNRIYLVLRKDIARFRQRVDLSQHECFDRERRSGKNLRKTTLGLAASVIQNARVAKERKGEKNSKDDFYAHEWVVQRFSFSVCLFLLNVTCVTSKVSESDLNTERLVSA